MDNKTLETIVSTESNQNTPTDPTNNNTRVPGTIQVIPNATFAKLIPDISKIEVFDGKNFKRWQDHIYSVLDMHEVAFVLIESLSPTASKKQIKCLIHANKESKEIWDNMLWKYIAQDVGKQKFIIKKFYRWEMTEDVEVKAQINEYHMLLEDLKPKNITFPKEFVAGLLIEKLPPS
ncbi:hypothetical protein HRI_001222800 [Hibiscus trionum]|uniref:Uncharacterized protein n=1 Tax=Hibiscus trionum TaxID=183268 RepID=A0A9W7HGT4_HIBTR|nr:hypothetical protein HRI_001222800 [Hibiscus trionum]